MTANDLIATRAIPYRLDFTSVGSERLQAVLSLCFGAEIDQICWYIDGDGYHLALPEDSGVVLPSSKWYIYTHQHTDYPLLQRVAAHVIRWLDSLVSGDKLVISSTCQDIQFWQLLTDANGFRIRSSSTGKGLHYMLTITPDWA